MVVSDSDEFSDFNTQLISWESYEEQINPYCEMLGFPSSMSEMVSQLRQQLINVATTLDQSYPNNKWFTISENGLTLHRHDKTPTPPLLGKIDEMITRELEQRSILDILVESEGWLDLHKRFGPISGFKGKIDDPRSRFITTLFCYGCNLGPSQTAQSIKELSRKQVAWLNLHHVT